MSFYEREHVGETVGHLSRRRMLAAVSAGVTVGLAGCEGTTIDVGRAGAVDLPSTGRESLVLAEGPRDAESITVDATNASEQDPGDADLTSHYAGFHRDPARNRSTALQGVRGIPAGNGMGEPVTVIRVSDAGYDSVGLSIGEREGEVAADRVNLVVPASALSDGEIVPAGALALTPLAALEDSGGEWLQSGSSDGEIRPDEVFEPGAERLRLVPVEDVFPADDWTSPAESVSDAALSRWVPGTDVDASGTVLVATGERTIEDVFGTPAEELPGRLLEEGETVDARETILAGPADQFVPGGPIWVWDELVEGGRPAPLGGATFGLGLFVTPRDDRHEGWPRPDGDLGSILRSERGRELVGSFVLDPGDRWPLAWREGPADVGVVRRASHELGDGGEVAVRSYVGAVDIGESAAAVGLHAGHVAYEDVDVTVVGGQWTPIGAYPASVQTPGDPSIDPEAQPSPVWQEWGAQGPWEGDDGSSRVEEQFPEGWNDWSQNPWIDWMEAGGSTTARAVGHLEPTG